MKNLNVLLIPAAALMLFAAVNSAAGQQPLPAMIYGDSLEERCHALVESSDPGFCLAGWTRSYSPGPAHTHKVLVMKTDPAGIPQWARVSIGESDEEARSMVRASDGGYCLTGWTGSYGIGLPNRNLFVTKLDIAGNAQWSYVWGWMMDDEAYSIVQTFDGGYAVAGLTHSFGPAPYPNVLVASFAANGFLRWARVYWAVPAHVEDEGYAIVQTPDSGFAVVGRAKVSSPATFDPFVLKTDKSGVLQWAYFSPGSDADDEGYAATLTLAGTIVVGGWTRSYGTMPPTRADIFIAEFQPGGAPTWSRTFGWPDGDEQLLEDRALCTAHDGGVAACGLTTSVGPGIPNPNFLLLKLDGLGNLQWCRSHPSAHDPGLLTDEGHPVVQARTRDYAAAGWTNSYNWLGGRDDFHFVVVDSLGNREVCVEPQLPIVGDMPWLAFEMEDSVVFLEPDSMPLVPVEVGFHPICEPTGAGEAPGPARPRSGARFLPNPATGTVRVTGLAGPARLALYDATGRAVARFELAGRQSERLDVGGLSAGVYLARFEGAAGTDVTRLLVR
ncbi:T9SS type A sorting domain-containing protein [candidate division WOR-3 bacterium]|nr:T9SS type A sorting domain-containing protein [candidate division WOR-3 bacterium]